MHLATHVHTPQILRTVHSMHQVHLVPRPYWPIKHICGLGTKTQCTLFFLLSLFLPPSPPPFYTYFLPLTLPSTHFLRPHYLSPTLAFREIVYDPTVTYGRGVVSPHTISGPTTDNNLRARWLFFERPHWVLHGFVEAVVRMCVTFFTTARSNEK